MDDDTDVIENEIIALIKKYTFFSLELALMERLCWLKMYCPLCSFFRISPIQTLNYQFTDFSQFSLSFEKSWITRQELT